MRAPTGIVMILKALGVNFNAEEVEKTIGMVIKEVPPTIEKLEAMNRAFATMSKALCSIEARLSVIEAQQSTLISAMSLMVHWIDKKDGAAVRTSVTRIGEDGKVTFEGLIPGA